MILVTLHVTCDGPLHRARQQPGCDQGFDCQVPLDFTGRVESGGRVDIETPTFNALPEGWTSDYRGTLCPNCTRLKEEYERGLARPLARARRKT